MQKGTFSPSHRSQTGFVPPISADSVIRGVFLLSDRDVLIVMLEELRENSPM
jgi:hypothetical protein